MVLGFDRPTAQALAERVLAGLPEAKDAAMQYDCLGEVANVVAGQAKALLAETPYHFYFSTPTVITGVHKDIRATPGRECLVLGFGSELGDFVLQVFVKMTGKTEVKLG
jgi:chemotaxis protein CheX